MYIRLGTFNRSISGLILSVAVLATSAPAKAQTFRRGTA
jgi:hypothetical protein